MKHLFRTTRPALTPSCSTGNSNAGDSRHELRECLEPRQRADADPRYGVDQTGDTPQEVLFIVTDGVEDEPIGSTRVQQGDQMRRDIDELLHHHQEPRHQDRDRLHLNIW